MRKRERSNRNPHEHYRTILGNEVDPLRCPKCAGEMKIISFIERHQREVIEKILRHCGLWEETSARAPPAGGVGVD